MTPDGFAKLHAKAFAATRAWTTEEFAQLLAQKGTIWHGNADCFVLMRVIVDEAEILTLATDPACRRQGLAQRTLAAGETAAKLAGVNHVFLEVAANNTAALALYAKSGYTKVGRRLGYYMPKDGAAIDAYVLRKVL